jgi:hypothetical protein
MHLPMVLDQAIAIFGSLAASSRDYIKVGWEKGQNLTG